MATAALKTRRINTGLYEVKIAGRTFEIEDIGRASDGEIPAAWMLYEIHGEIETREFWKDFGALRAAKAAILAEVGGAA